MQTTQTFSIIFLGAIGLTLLVLAQALGEERTGELGEKVLTVVGAGFVAFGHWLNYHLCHTLNQNDCNCSNGKHTGI